MKETIDDITKLFEEAKQRSEFDFILTLINYTNISEKGLSTNLHEWFEAIEFYKTIFYSSKRKEKTRIGVLLYSTFFENSDFYNIIGSLCKIKLGFRGSSYLFWKTKKYERQLGIGEKQDLLIELLEDAGKVNIISFFYENHFKEIRNTFFHSAYSLSDFEYFLHDSEPIMIEGIGQHSFDIEKFLFPKIENVIRFFDEFRQFYTDSFTSYKSNKEIDALFPTQTKATILGSKDGLRGFKIKNSVQLYGKSEDSGIWYDDKKQIWAGYNIQMYFNNVETIEVVEGLVRYENKSDIKRNDSEFVNLIDKVLERNLNKEIARATHLLIKFGNARYEKMNSEQNLQKKKNFPKIILPYYRQAVEIGSQIYDMTEVRKRIRELE